MADTDSHSEPSLKVSDRRHFTESGERRKDVEASVFEEKPAPPPPKAAASPAKPAEPAAAKEAKSSPPPQQPRLAAREITFTTLIQDLYATALMQLGAELQPGQPGQMDLEGARETIDLLGMLQQKTHGNLDKQEQRIMDGALYELRMVYVETLRQTAAVTPAAPPLPRR